MVEVEEVNEMRDSRLANAGSARADRFISRVHSRVCGENMIKTRCDKKGRIYLRPSIRTKYGRDFLVVEKPGELVLLPVPADPLKDLREWGKPLQRMSMEEIKRAIEEQAEEEVNRVGVRQATARTAT